MREGSDGFAAVWPRPVFALEHFPEKWAPVFRKKMRQIKNLERFPIHLKRKAL
jgi:hypothetical protein